MAKKSAVERDKKRRRLVVQQAERRAELKATVMDRTTSPEERFDAAMKLAELPRNGSKVRVHNRCEITGRAVCIESLSLDVSSCGIWLLEVKFPAWLSRAGKERRLWLYPIPSVIR
jgi:hypothetical protein